MTEEVIPDVSSAGLNLTTLIEETTAEVDEAARAGDYETPFDPVPERIRDLCAVGALAKARQALEMSEPPEGAPYRREFEAGLERLRRAEMDLGKVSVSDESVTLPADPEEWVKLGHRAVELGSVAVMERWSMSRTAMPTSPATGRECRGITASTTAWAGSPGWPRGGCAEARW